MKKTTSINSTLFFIQNKNPFDTFIWLGKNYIQLAITDAEHTKIEVLESFKKEEGNITRSEAIEILKGRLVQGATQVYVGFESKKNTLIPTPLFDKNKLALYLKQLYTIENEEVIVSQKISSLNCHSIYTLKKGTQKLLLDEVPSAQFFHATSALLLAYQQMIRPNKKLNSFIRLQENEILITVFKENNLMLHQIYDIESMEDGYYYYLNVLKQLEMPREKMLLSLFGDHPQIEDFKRTLDANVDMVKLINRLPTLKYTDEVFSHPAHHFFNLFSLVLCA